MFLKQSAVFGAIFATLIVDLTDPFHETISTLYAI